MRGAHWHFDDDLDERGIIPAYAGSTTQSNGKILGKKDHPRVCGEHLQSRERALKLRGSSPRMRGALDMHSVHLVNSGIIPAYAGSTDT